ncbi:hypothetical protein HPB47_006390 [Ixodes persulcatus]|uniref:Uncharacterized protein n=1 Tax=Ixodes persulcatus TaxID=34615 RepID=A0AC60PBD9_IXOPE|nr:hypothetical protein HPB47_006390 [Ixodes persulcatus]
MGGALSESPFARGGIASIALLAAIQKAGPSRIRPSLERLEDRIQRLSLPAIVTTPNTDSAPSSPEPCASRTVGRIRRIRSHYGPRSVASIRESADDYAAAEKRNFGAESAEQCSALSGEGLGVCLSFVVVISRSASDKARPLASGFRGDRALRPLTPLFNAANAGQPLATPTEHWGETTASGRSTPGLVRALERCPAT